MFSTDAVSTTSRIVLDTNLQIRRGQGRGRERRRGWQCWRGSAAREGPGPAAIVTSACARRRPLPSRRAPPASSHELVEAVQLLPHEALLVKVGSDHRPGVRLRDLAARQVLQEVVAARKGRALLHLHLSGAATATAAEGPPLSGRWSGGAGMGARPCLRRLFFFQKKKKTHEISIEIEISSKAPPRSHGSRLRATCRRRRRPAHGQDERRSAFCDSLPAEPKRKDEEGRAARGAAGRLLSLGLSQGDPRDAHQRAARPGLGRVWRRLRGDARARQPAGHLAL